MGDLHQVKKHINTCRSCHFLSKYFVHGNSDQVSHLTWTQEERETIQIDDYFTAECFRGIWNVGIEPGLKTVLEEIVNENRRDDCFYVKFRKGMSYQGATELHRIRNDNRQLRKSYRYTQWGLAIAAIGLIANALVQLYLGISVTP